MNDTEHTDPLMSALRRMANEKADAALDRVLAQPNNRIEPEPARRALHALAAFTMTHHDTAGGMIGSALGAVTGASWHIAQENGKGSPRAKDAARVLRLLAALLDPMN